jgi:hypothetical protein
MTEDVGGDVLKAISRYKKLIDEDIDERFVLYEFMQFRRAYDADYLDFNIEKTLSEWNANALKLGSPEDFFNTPLARAYGIEGQDPQPSPGETPSSQESNPSGPAEPMPKETVPSEPASPEPTSVEAPSVKAPLNRPPTLENPGQ